MSARILVKMVEPGSDSIRIDKLFNAMRRCTMAAFPTWIGRIPAVVLVLFSVPFGILSVAFQVTVAVIAIAAYRLMLKGRVLGAILQLAGIGALSIEFVLEVQRLLQLGSSTSRPPPPSLGFSWFLVLLGSFLLWGVVETLRCQRIAADYPLVDANHGRLRRRLRRLRAPKPRLKAAVVSGAWAVLLIVASIATAFLAASHLEDISEYPWVVLAVGFALYLLLLLLAGELAMKSLFKARRLAAPTAADILRVDPRLPSMLLRSFNDDLTPLKSRYRLGKGVPFLPTPEQLTLEETIANVLDEFGPIIAIGRPGENLPPVGAAREYLGNIAWQEAVDEHMRTAQWIVVILGQTEGLSQEYTALRQLKTLANVIVVFPPIDPVKLGTRWKLFVERTIGTAPSTDLNDALVAIFRNDRQPTFILCKEKDEQSYELALQHAFSLLLQTAQSVA